MDSTKYDDVFKANADATGVPWHLLKAQAIVESGLDPHAESPRGARGIAQFMDATWREWGEGADVYDAGANIRAQARYMAWLLKHFKADGAALALAAYNFGVGHVEREMPWPQETFRYVQAVLAKWAELQAAAAVPANYAPRVDDGAGVAVVSNTNRPGLSGKAR